MENSILEKHFMASEVDVVYRSRVPASQRMKITCSQDSFNLLKRFYDLEKLEHIETSYLLLLNRANRVLGVKKLGEGGIDHCILDVRVIFQTAIKTNATGIIIAHNHPSGNRKLSDADKQITKKISEGGKLLDIQLFDHIVITGENEYVSFADEGEL